MYRLFLFMALAAFFSFAHAQNKVTDSTATVVGFWKNGEKKFYRFSQEEWSEKEGDTAAAKKIITQYFAQLNILDSSESGYTVEWIMKGVKTLNSPDPNSQRIFAISEGLRFLYTTDPSGAFGDLLNLDEIKSHIHRGFDGIMADKSFIPEAKANLAKIRDRMLEDANIEQLYIEDIRYMHYLYGYEFHKDHPMLYESEMENAYGGEPLQAKNEIHLQRIEPSLDNVVLRMSSSIDKEQGQKVLTASQKALDRDTASGPGVAHVKPNKIGAIFMEIDLTLLYNISIRTGWVKTFTYIKDVKLTEMKFPERHVKRIDIRDFELPE